VNTEADSGTLSVAGVTFGYDERLVLDDVSLDVSAGERVAIVGANGAGKTTLLKLMADLLRPNAGVVRLGARDVRAFSRRALAKRLGIVPQELAVPFGFTARELVRQRWIGASLTPRWPPRRRRRSGIDSWES
jgi:iron complex transport system ATP-binding protein